MGVIAAKRQVGSIGPVGVVRQQSSNQYQRIAAATNKLTELAIGEMGRQAAISGKQLAQEENISKITTLDPITNKPEALSWVEDNSFLGRVGKEAYEETIAKRFQFEIDNQLKIKAKELAIKYQDKDGGVELFKDQMHQYIDSMATGSEATGYSNYIMQSGVALTTTTSLNLMDKAAARERTKTTSVIVTGLEDQLDALETLVSNGDLDRADIIRKDIISTSENAFASSHFTREEARAYKKAAALSYARGYLRDKLVGLNSDQISNVLNSLVSGNYDSLNEELHDTEIQVLSGAAEFLTKDIEVNGETITTVDYDAIKSLSTFVEGQYQSTKLAEDRRATEALLGTTKYDTAINNSRGVGPEVLDSSDFPTEDSKINELKNRYDATETLLNDRELKDPVLRQGIPSTDQEKLDVRMRMSFGLLIPAYEWLQDNTDLSPPDIVKALQESYDTGNTGRNFGSLIKGDARVAMEVIKHLKGQTGGLNDPQMDEFITGLGQVDIRNSEKAKIEEEVKINETIENFILNPVANYDEAIKYINASSLSQPQKNARTTELNVARANVILNNAIQRDSSITSDKIVDAATYASMGIEKDSLTPELKAAVDESKEYLNDGQISSLLSTKATRLNSSESKANVGFAKREAQNAILSGQTLANTASNKEAAEELIVNFSGGMTATEFFLSDQTFATRPDGTPQNPAALALMQSIHAGVLPTTLNTLFKSLANGVPTQNPDQALNLITLYKQFSSQPKGGLPSVNIISHLLGKETSGKLEAIITARLMTNESVNEIANRLANTDLEEVKLSMKRKFGDKHDKPELTVNDFVALEVPDAKNNSQAIKMLGSYALYMGSLGMSADSISENLDIYYNRMFSNTEGYVIDAASESGQKSRYSFNHIFTDASVKEFFVEKVNKELMDILPNGQSLMISTDDNPVSNRAYLMPIGVDQGGGVRFMVVMNHNGNYIPVVGKSGYPVGFSTGESDVVDFAKSINREKFMNTYTLQEINAIRESKIAGDKIQEGLSTDVDEGYVLPEGYEDSPYAGAGQ